ncbi:hypothetical protein N7499_004583 [Penicillium canescens]|nr:hypothetical protein N7499_004583 [Penicillium canescens]KAJ6161740.1 hypothetical protein N7485_009970 [Penicillium canescens]
MSKGTVRKARFDSSLTREGDFAPNAGDHESNDEEDLDLHNVSDQDAPEEHQLNQKIRGANEQNHVNDIDVGTIPELGYNGLCETWQQKANIAVENNSAQETKDGLPEEHWEYTGNDVEDIIGISWKIEDDDEEGVNPLDLLRPAKGAIYPLTRALVTWKDGITTLEGRAFIRRITTGSALDGDRVIYQKAEEFEAVYCETHGLGEYDDGVYDDRDRGIESDSSVSSKRARNRRHHTEPGRSSRSTKKKSKHQSRNETSDSSDAESDTSSQAHNSHRRRYRSEPVARRNSNPPRRAL